MIPMATWKKPKLQRKDKWKRQTITSTNEIWEKENRGKYLTTWTSPNGNINRQIDYITINAKTAEYSTESTEQHLLARKHAPEPTTPGTNNATILLRIKEIQETNTSRNRKTAKYGIKGLRGYPEKRTQAYQEHREQNRDKAEIEHEWREWEDYQKH